MSIETSDPSELDHLDPEQIVFQVTAFRRQPNDEVLGCGIETDEKDLVTQLEAVNIVLHVMSQYQDALKEKVIREAIETKQKIRKLRSTMSEAQPIRLDDQADGTKH